MTDTTFIFYRKIPRPNRQMDSIQKIIRASMAQALMSSTNDNLAVNVAGSSHLRTDTFLSQSFAAS